MHTHTTTTTEIQTMTTIDSPTSYDNIIDSRDVIARIKELESERQDWIDEKEEAGIEFDMSPETDWHNANTDDAEELAALQALTSEGEGYSDWHDGAQLIRDSYFTEYAQELAEEIGAINSDNTWPNNCIDWEQAARELQYDYSGIEFDGVTYWVR